ncbi:hypothetical protein AAY473_002400, partial [Plecturocebus cupreus]
MRSGVQDQPGRDGETPSLLKIEKLARYCGRTSTLGGRGGQITGQEIKTILANMLLRRLKQENCLNPGGGGCSEPRLCHCTPAWRLAMERDSVSKKNNNNNSNNSSTCDHYVPYEHDSKDFVYQLILTLKTIHE